MLPGAPKSREASGAARKPAAAATGAAGPRAGTAGAPVAAGLLGRSGASRMYRSARSIR